VIAVHWEPHLPAGQRSSIAFMISSAHRTASAIALIVAGTLLPPSNCASLRAARMLAADQQHAFAALIHVRDFIIFVFCSPMRFGQKNHTCKGTCRKPVSPVLRPTGDVPNVF
jgi:hypothetical protein